MTGKTKRGSKLNLWVCLPLPVIFLLAGIEFADSQIDGNSILLKVDEYRAPADNFVFDSVVQNAEGKIEISVHVRNVTKGLVRFTNPPDFAGRAILYVDENMWIYVPGTRRALRISPNQRMLGGASSADISRTVFANDYIVKSTTEDGNSLKLELEAKSRKVAYARINLSVDPGDYRPLSAEFYARSGNRLLKTMFFENYKDVLGKQRPQTTRIVDHVENDSETVMNYSNMRVEDTPEAWYQPSYLGRL